jgi:hypothetical protein
MLSFWNYQKSPLESGLLKHNSIKSFLETLANGYTGQSQSEENQRCRLGNRLPGLTRGVHVRALSQ